MTIYDLLNAETKPKKISEIIGISLWALSNPDHNPLEYTISGILENKTNAISHPNIAIEEKWNKMSEEFILKACKYNNWTKQWPYWVDLLFWVYLLILLFIIKQDQF